MIPSTLAAEVANALKDFLITGFGPSNPALATVMDDFIADGHSLVKGPYLSIELPFERVPGGGEPFPQTPLGVTPYRHQRQAFNRLAAGRSTLVATGTGSGKTECFLYPVLDHCRVQAGHPGIKAIVVYPMNALASDQARRIAGIVHRTPSLRGKVTAGLFVGDSSKSPRRRMTGEHLIENREVLREHPPDILLTNYKMLDLLLTRPIDAGLWSNNSAGTLRFLVVDELHTFDGAQGTDLACLIRRLRVRLQVGNDLVCVGTSATIGAGEDRERVMNYASDLFHQPFDADALIGEVRQGIDDFLADAIISHHLLARPDLGELLEPNGYATLEDYVRSQYALFFGEPLTDDFAAAEWRVNLGAKLRGHATFVNFLRMLDRSRPTPMVTVLERLGRSLPTADTRDAENLLNALCALISIARHREPSTGASGDVEDLLPFLNVKLHLWVRELRRMVCSVSAESEDGFGTKPERSESAPVDSERLDDAPGGEPPEPPPGGAATPDEALESQPPRRLRYHLRFSDDLKADEDSVHLPLIQCRECHVTGWGCFKQAAEQHIHRDLRMFYNRFFLRDVDVSYLFPLEVGESPPRGARGREHRFCGRCGYLAAADAGKCPGCDSGDLTRVFRPDSVRRRGRGQAQRRELSRDCPWCGAREALIIVGARATSLLSTALAQLFASRHNDDRKVIAFSDNVQDAAHRGSFFSARTWRNSVRAAVAQTVISHDGILLRDLPDTVVEWWADTAANRQAFDANRYISEFIAPDRLWLQDFESLRENGDLPDGSKLLSLVQHRLRWDSLAELTFGSAIGRTLERTRIAAVGIEPDALERACESLFRHIREHFGELQAIQPHTARSLVLGILRRMKDRGAVQSPLFEKYLGSGGNLFTLNHERALQDFGPRSALPVFPGQRGLRDGVEALVGARRKSWYQRWTTKVLTPINVLAATANAADVLRAVMTALTDAGLIRIVPAGSTHVWALDPEQYYVTVDTAVVRCRSSHRELVVPRREAGLWQGVPCMDLAADDSYGDHEQADPTWAGRLYRDADIHRIVSAEHTALISREERDRLQERFAAANRMPWEPNLLSATPTLELGVDIGDLSTVVMCSVPPAAMNYVQRAGRAGRRDGNALALTVATGQPHDLYHYAEPMEMLGNRVDPPSVFLNAPAVLERQLAAFCFDCWVAGGVEANTVPATIRQVIDNVEKSATAGFPYPLFEFVANNEDAILKRFFEGFESSEGTGDGLDDASREYLTRYLRGDERGESMRQRMIVRLSEVAKERQSIRNDIEALGRRIRALRGGPDDESRTREFGELSGERRALQRVLAKMNGRDTFGFLTDEGLLPNYAFPEPGVRLDSVIYKRRHGGDGESEQDVVVYDYVRPAVAALGEFAPENRFYAGGRRVEIRRVDTRVSPIENWRLCPSCAYCESIDTGDRNATCPRCGDPLWADAGQRREMLRMRLVHAATPDSRSRIMDERDDREPMFYTRQLVADFEPDLVTRAFASTSADCAFGFEYVPSATFREMNFGRLDDTGSPTRFAGESMPRVGFRVCRRCGGVQGNQGEIQHTRTCKAVEADDIADCMYLYREFTSEAVRMLIPTAGSLNSEQRISSFIAALELGLRRRFSGAVDHLRVMTCRFPAPESGADLDYLMLYDSVPGGTGYLKQTMNDPLNVLEVFRGARDAIAACECNADPTKDGCYRCVYAYRRSYDMASTSRATALELLGAILEHADLLEEVPGLHKVKVNPLLESELEARFVEALGRVEADGKPVRVRQDIVGGKPGFVLTSAGLTWFMAPQVELGEAQGVAIPSRPDFLIRPAREPRDRPSIAIFMDGFEYHRTKTDDDSAKRMALVRAGYLVWSLTWQDLEVVLGKPDSASILLGGDDGSMAQLQQQLDKRWSTGLTRSRLNESSLTLLVRYLQSPELLTWQRAVFTELLRMFVPAEMMKPELKSGFMDSVRLLSSGVIDAVAALPEETAIAGKGSWRAPTPRFAQIFLALPLTALPTSEAESPKPDEMLVAVHLDDAAQSEQADYRREWNGVLRLFNLLQFLPNAWWTTSLGVDRGVYPDFPIRESSPDTSTPAEWQETLALVAEELRPFVRSLAERGVHLPEVGYELISEDRGVVAEAELAWESKRIAVLLPDQDRRAFEAAKWRVLPADVQELATALAD